MCGLTGVFQPKGTFVSADLLRTMGGMLDHRGPDNFGVVADANIGFAHTRLSLLDLSEAANQPFQDDNYVLTFGGEIYNYQEIRKHLIEEYGVVFRTTSDTEVLFHSLINDGIDECLRQIKGMFAFAFFDKKRDELILARDRLGIKPLYYVNHANGFYWSSEMKVLAKVLDIPPDPLKTLFALGGMGERSKRNTLFRGIYPVEPGNYLKLNSSLEISHTKYYDARDQFDLSYYKKLDGMNSATIVSEFERLFVASVERMLMSDVPLGAFVSGGVDSSLIAAVASLKRPDIKLFVSDVVGHLSEYKDAKLVAEHIGCQIYDHKFEPEMFLRDWAEATYYYESPIVVHTNSIPFASVARLARQSGVKAVLTGEGADELFLGYPKLLTRRYKSLALLPNTLVKSLYKMIPGLSEYLFPAQDLSIPTFLARLAQNFESQQVSDDCDNFTSFNGGKKLEHQMTLRMINEHLITLLHRNDRMGMMASIEARFPYLDEDVVKFAINLPSKYKIGQSARFHNYKHPFLIDKWIVRKIAERYLPRQIVYKKKFGFGMIGHKYVEVQPEFFKNGWLAEVLNWDSKTVDYLTKTQNPYFVAKLVSVEVFGQIFGFRESIEQVSSKILKQIRMKSVSV